MAIIGVCAGVWCSLLLGFIACCLGLPRPWSASDLCVLALIGVAAVVFARLGLVSTLTLALRLLPAGRVRSGAAGIALRLAPRTLRAGVLAAASLACAAQVAAAPAAGPAAAASPEVTVATELPDPGWPTAPADPEAPAAPGGQGHTHVVAAGESLWSIASDYADTDAARAALVAAIHSDNRAVIGADPNLIMPGQRLEIRP